MHTKKCFEHRSMKVMVQAVALAGGGFGWAYRVDGKQSAWSCAPHFETAADALVDGEAAVLASIVAWEATGVWPRRTPPPEDGEGSSS